MNVIKLENVVPAGTKPSVKQEGAFPFIQRSFTLLKLLKLRSNIILVDDVVL